MSNSLYWLHKNIPPPPRGERYKPISFGEKILKKKRREKGKCERKKKKRKDMGNLKKIKGGMKDKGGGKTCQNREMFGVRPYQSP
jgi:hypothetical protein